MDNNDRVITIVSNDGTKIEFNELFQELSEAVKEALRDGDEMICRGF